MKILYYSGKNSFYSNLIKMIDYYDLNCDFFVIHWMTGLKLKRYVVVIGLLLEADPSTITKTQFLLYNQKGE